MADQRHSGTTRRDLLKVGGISLGTVGGAAFFPSIASAAPGEPATAVIPAAPKNKYFLQLSGIAGESTDDRHKGQIEILAWSWGVKNTSNPIAGGGGGSSKPTPLDFIFISRLSIASPPIMLAAATSRHIPFALLSVVHPGSKSATTFMTLRLDDVLVNSYQQSSGDTDGFPVDVVHLGYSRITYTDHPQRADGTLGSPIVSAFDFRSGKAG